jgi:TRAP transporter 4TM/12TM fusion protein
MQPIEKKTLSDHKTERPWVLTTGVALVGVVFSLYHILVILHVFESLGLGSLSAISHRAISLGLIMVLGFTLYPFRRSSFPKAKVLWVDYLLIFLSVITCTYIVLYYEGGWLDPNLHPLQGEVREIVEVTLGIISILLVLEVTRRVMGLALPLIAFIFVVYTRFSNYFPGFFTAHGYSLTRITDHLYLWSEGIWGVAMGVAAITIVAFIIFSSFISESGAGSFFIEIANSLLGRKRGGPAKAAIVSDALFGMVSGSTTASVMTTGVFTIPMMKKVGYSPNFAGAVEAVASNGAQVMPPVMGAVAFIICEFLSIDYRDVITASVIPSLFYWLVLYLTIDYRAVMKGIKGLPESEISPFMKVFKAGWFYIVPVCGLVFFLAVLKFSPERSALFAIGVLLIISFFWRDYRMGPKDILQALALGGKSMVLVSSACATAGIIMGCMTLTGLGTKISSVLLMASHGNLLLLLLLSAIACYILGMGMSSIPVYLTVAIMVAPALVKFGVSPLAAHLFVFWWALSSFITPPVAVAAIAASGLARGDPFRTGFEGMRLGAGLYLLPFMFVFRPGLLLMDSPGGIAWATLVCCISIVCLAGGLNGYLLARTKILDRILLAVGGVLVIFPGVATVLGLIMIALGLAFQVLARKRTKEFSPKGINGAIV